MIRAAVVVLVRMYPGERHMSVSRPNLVELAWIALKPAAVHSRCREGLVLARMARTGGD